MGRTDGERQRDKYTSFQQWKKWVAQQLQVVKFHLHGNTQWSDSYFKSSWPIAMKRWKQAMKCSGDREDILHRLSVSDCLSHAHTQTCTCAHAHTYKASQMSSWSLLFWTFNQLSSAHKHHCEHWNAGRFKIIQPGWSFWLEDPAFLFMLISFFSWSPFIPTPHPSHWNEYIVGLRVDS